MHRFFIDEKPKDKLITIIGKDAKHIKDVLRMKSGDMIEIVYDNIKYTCKINRFDTNSVILDIVQFGSISNEPKLKINLYQSIPKSNKMELILQKCTEIGVTSFTPVITARTIVKIDDLNKELKKISRWQSIVHEASKQSKRDIIPVVNPIISFRDAINQFMNNITIVPYENEHYEDLHSVRDKYINSEQVNILIGPEGGFTEQEINELKEINSIVVSLGPRILRTETAGLVISTILLHEAHDLGVIK
ncbi:MAG TPA: RsmE family RNA methyltransferase [Soehngenia sp.]|nr:RsmE family RNA methyltransferase [Soehngenia sp.]HPP31222.1 RsmE family RNA methyltransferase [Soehngenia sp.]